MTCINSQEILADANELLELTRSYVAGYSNGDSESILGVQLALIHKSGAQLYDRLNGIDDSKLLTKSRREELFAVLQSYAHIGIGGASAAEIDRINILAATLRAMGRAVDDLGIVPDLALIDGNRTPELACPATAVVRGDRASLSIAAASIVAKVTRDRIMAALARRHPGFGWERNAGYGTMEHKQALTRLGVTPHHRKTFAPINKILSLS
ncbi:MAG: ribonuclease HII [Proteobacteria bacterium]|nr:ribonuclease HII [Pseudomonadota bacterium]